METGGTFLTAEIGPGSIGLSSGCFGGISAAEANSARIRHHMGISTQARVSCHGNLFVYLIFVAILAALQQSTATLAHL